MLNGLNDLAKERLVEEGPRGELAARFILLQALSESGRDPNTSVQLNYCKVSELLGARGGYIEDVERTTKWIRAFFTLDQRQRECAARECQPAAIAMAFHRGAETCMQAKSRSH